MSDSPRPQSGWRVPVRRILIVLASAIAACVALGVGGLLLPGLPVVGTLGTMVWSMMLVPLMLLAILGLVSALVAWKLGVRRMGVIVSAVTVLSLVGSSVVLGDQLTTASRYEVDANLASALSPAVYGDSGQPDATLEYGTDDGEPLELDLYRPVETEDPAPVVVYVHGGGWIIGDKAAQSSNLEWFAEQGYLAAGINYTLATEDHATWDTAMPQVACGLGWLAEHAAEYGGDPDRIFVYGESAGGALTLGTSYALAAGELEPWCDTEIPSIRAVAAQVPAVDPVSFYDNDDDVLGDWSREMVSHYLGGTPSEHPDRVAVVSPINYLDPAVTPPTLVFTSESDHLVPVAGVDEFISEATDAGIDLTVVRRNFSDHTVDLQYGGIPNQLVLQLMDRHFRANGA
ncbi:alpha/beta hydrolase fold domain-containing protein [Microbacterium sp. NPDC077663]|uniref:alpha/beta hydrolase fold domain-containing protein n=1 Tax=Microbacterium sp. NPDC077663 TaxID=3364189 RepID=UPI0037CC6AB7